jgi:hypothetical protein
MMLFMRVAMIRVTEETRDVINKIAQDDFGGVSADEALRRLAREHRRALWIEQARRLREEQPDVWQDATAEMVRMADAVAGDAGAGDPWEHSQ